MHSSAMEWVSHCVDNNQKYALGVGTGNHVLEIGSLDINGSVRGLFDTRISYGGDYVGIDLQEGPGVDIVADAATFTSGSVYDIVVCCEVFEHAQAWCTIISNVHRLLTPGGLFIATMAGVGRHPHSAIDENPIRSWEYYGNVQVSDLDRELSMFSTWKVSTLGTDLRCWAIK